MSAKTYIDLFGKGTIETLIVPAVGRTFNSGDEGRYGYVFLQQLGIEDHTRERIREHLLSVRNRESTMGRFDAVREGGDQWFRLPLTLLQVAPCKEHK